MNLNELFPVQKKFDELVVKSRKLNNDDLFVKKVQALKVEIAELDNEIKVFKYWSDKKMNRDKALEEFADCVHFALSLGNDLGYTEHHYTNSKPIDLTTLSLGLTNAVTFLSAHQTKGQMQTVFNLLLKYGYQIGFTEDEVIAAYYKKNETNYARQENGY